MVTPYCFEMRNIVSPFATVWYVVPEAEALLVVTRAGVVPNGAFTFNVWPAAKTSSVVRLFRTSSSSTVRP